MSDPQKYRSKEEVARYQQHDPIGRLEKLLDATKVETINAENRELVEAAHQEADAAAFPPKENLWRDVYAQPFPPYSE